jgi:hypothetical protein
MFSSLVATTLACLLLVCITLQRYRADLNSPKARRVRTLAQMYSLAPSFHDEVRALQRLTLEEENRPASTRIRRAGWGGELKRGKCGA